MDAAKEIRQIAGEVYAIVYMDFRKDIDLMVRCFKEVGIEDVRVYHGKLRKKTKKE